MAGTSAGTAAVGTVPGAGCERAAAAGCNMAAGLAGSNHSPLAVHTAVASVRKSNRANEELKRCREMNSNTTLTPSCEKGSQFNALHLSSLDKLTFCFCSRTIYEVNGDRGLPSKCYFIRYQVLMSHESLVAKGSIPDTDI